MLRRLNLLLTLALVVACRSTPTRVEISLPANGAPMNEYFEFDVSIDGAPPDSIVVDADMPGHKHGMASTPIVRSIAKGRYHVEGMLFHMPGEWEIYVDLVRGTVRERRTFPVEVEP